MNSKLIVVVETVYKYIQIGFYFWIYLLRGFIIYGIVPTGCALILTIHDIRNPLEDSDIKNLYKNHYKKYAKYKLQSFVFIFIIIISYSALFYLNDYNNNISIIATIFFIYIGLMTIVIFTYCIHFLVWKNVDFKQSIILSFVTSIRKLMISISILGIFILLFAIGKFNFLLLLVVAPTIYGILSTLVMRTVIE